MGQYILKRILGAIPILVIVGVCAFFLIHLIPGDPALVMLGIEATPEQVEVVRQEMGLNKPLHIQLLVWFSKIARGDLGNSYFLHRPVTEAIGERLPATVALSVLALVFGVIIGVPAGIIAAVKQDSWIDQLVMTFALAGVSMPSFWLGLTLMMIFAVQLGYFPTGGYVPVTENLVEGIRHMVLPVMSLGFMQAALVARMTRSSMLEVLRQDYIRTARAKGISDRVVILKHALRNAAVPILTVTGTGFGVLLGGSAITETVFTYPGIGRLVILAVQRRDYPLVQGVILTTALLCVLVNIAVDIAYSFVDPRIEYE